MVHIRRMQAETYSTGIERQVFRPHIVEVCEYFESVHQISLLGWRGLKAVRVYAYGAEVVVGGGGGKGFPRGVLPEFAACGHPTGVGLCRREWCL